MIDGASYERFVDRLFVKPVGDQIGKTLHAAVGVSGEAGELLDMVKKTWIYGKPLDRENLVEEAGDLIFYITAILINNGFTLEDAIGRNMEKLAKRYPNGYSDTDANARADKQPPPKPTPRLVNVLRVEETYSNAAMAYKTGLLCEDGMGVKWIADIVWKDGRRHPTPSPGQMVDLNEEPFSNVRQA